MYIKKSSMMHFNMSLLQLAHNHRVILLKAITLILQDSIENVDKELAVEMIKQTSEEMTQTKVILCFICKIYLCVQPILLCNLLLTTKSVVEYMLISVSICVCYMKQEVVPEWQSAASDVLVALGAKYCFEVMEDLLQKFEPGVLPHFFVVQTMANLAASNGT